VYKECDIRRMLTYPQTQRAIEIVQRAIDEDVKQNYAEAYKQYQNALDYFMLAMKCTSEPGMLHS
jgi:vacuolar protein-sorting-associated protein 4